MKKALVIHPILSFYAGGEYLCLNVCQALQEMDYRVTLASDSFRPAEFERLYGLGRVIGDCDYVRIPEFKPNFTRLIALQRAGFVERIQRMFKDVDAEVVFSTQSSPFIVRRRMFHFVYDAGDVLSYPAGLGPLRDTVRSGSKGIYNRLLNKLLWGARAPEQDWFFALGSSVLNDLRSNGYRNCSLALPPSRLDFKPRFPKKNQVVQAARIVPNKRLERFFAIAKRLPNYRFFLIGRKDTWLYSTNQGYVDKLLSSLPSNVEYIDSPVRDHPELLEESKIYVYTGDEKGIGLSLIEAIGAGCMPFSPKATGGSEVQQILGVGEAFENVEDAVAKIRGTLETEIPRSRIIEVSETAKKFSPYVFKEWIGEIARTGKPQSPGGPGHPIPQ